jgi:hypothetical protein
MTEEEHTYIDQLISKEKQPLNLLLKVVEQVLIFMLFVFQTI